MLTLVPHLALMPHAAWCDYHRRRRALRLLGSLELRQASLRHVREELGARWAAGERGMWAVPVLVAAPEQPEEQPSDLWDEPEAVGVLADVTAGIAARLDHLLAVRAEASE